MTLIIEVASAGGSEWDAGDWTDITDKVKVWDGARFGHSAHQGEVGTGSGFDLYTTSGISLPVKRLFRARETATSPDTMLMRGRIAGIGVGPWPLPAQRLFDVEVDDANAELRGIPIRKWVRPRESDYARLVALWKAYLKGDDSTANYFRHSTRLVITRDGEPRWARNANRVTLPKQTYTDTDPAGVLADIAEAAAKEFFVTNRMEIFYDLPLSTKFAAGLSITDVDPDGEASFAAEIDARGERDGSEFLSGVVVTYGKNKRVGRYRPAVETAHDFWREVIPIDSTSAADARKRATATLQGQAREDVTVSCSIVLRDDQVDLVRAGQTLSFRDSAAGVTSPVVLRVGRLMWEPLKPGLYRAHMELGFPKKLVPRIRRGLGKNPGNRTASSGPAVESGQPCDPTPEQVGGGSVANYDVFSGGGWVVDVDMPTSEMTAGRLLVGILGWTNQALNDVDAAILAEGFSHVGEPEVSGDHAANVFYKVLTGSEGWSGTMSLTLSEACTIAGGWHIYDSFAAGPDIAWNVDEATADPPALSTGWPVGTGVMWLTALVSDVFTGISGDPAGYGSSFGGGVDAPSLLDALDIQVALSTKQADEQSDDPTAYTCASPLLAWTVAIRGEHCAGLLTGEAGQVFGATPVTVV